MTPEQAAHLARIKSFVPLAEAGGVPGAVMVAQGTVESGWGRSGLARKGNAYFGIKARPSWPGAVYSGSTYEVINGRSVRFPGKNTIYPSYEAAIDAGANPVALFRAYPTFEENIRDYVAFFNRNPRYRAALERYAASRNPGALVDDIAFAEDIHRAGYATATDYARTLAQFMETYCQDLLGPDRVAVAVKLGPDELPTDAVRMLEDGRVFVHVRTLADLVGWRVRWDPETRTVMLDP